MLTHIYEIYKDGTDDPIYRAAKETAIKKRIFVTVGEGDGGKT